MSPETVYAFLTRLFPEGTRPEQSPGCDKAPILPTDVFAAAASLVERCEIYRHVMAFEGVASAAGAPGELVVTPAERRTWMDLGRRWRESPKDAAADIQAYWDRLMNAGRARVDGVQGEACPAWWRDALALSSSPTRRASASASPRRRCIGRSFCCETPAIARRRSRTRLPGTSCKRRRPTASAFAPVPMSHASCRSRAHPGSAAPCGR